MKVLNLEVVLLPLLVSQKKVLNIVKSDSERRFVVVSAPGKRNAEDTKVTDALIKYYRDYVAGNDISKSQSWDYRPLCCYGQRIGTETSCFRKNL